VQQQQPPPPAKDEQPITTTIVQIVPEKPAEELSMIDVSLAAFGLIGVIMVAALLAGLVAGAAYIWYRSRRAVTIIEARGHQHNLFRG
jgi:type II secretory pathway pseudopilin PulG